MKVLKPLVIAVLLLHLALLPVEPVQGWGFVKKTFRKATKAFKKGVSAAFKELSAAAEKAIKEAAEAAEKAAEAARTEVEEVMDNVGSAAMTAGRAVHSTAVDIGEGFENFGEGVALAAVTAAMEANHMAESAGSFMEDLAEDAWEEMKDGFNEFISMFGCWTEGILECIPEVKKAMGKIEDMAGLLTQAIQDDLGKIFQARGEELHDAGSEFISDLIRVFDQSGKKDHKDKNDFLEFLNDLKEFINLNVPDIPSDGVPNLDFGALDLGIFEKVFKSIIGIFSDMFDVLAKLVEDYFALQRRRLNQGAVDAGEICFTVSIGWNLGKEAFLLSPSVDGHFCCTTEGATLKFDIMNGQFSSDPDVDMTGTIAFGVNVGFGVGTSAAGYELLDEDEVHISTTQGVTVGASIPFTPTNGMNTMDFGFGGEISFGTTGINLDLHGSAGVTFLTIPPELDPSEAYKGAGSLVVAYTSVQVPLPIYGDAADRRELKGGISSMKSAMENAASDSSFSAKEIVAMTNVDPNIAKTVVVIKGNVESLNKWCLTAPFNRRQKTQCEGWWSRNCWKTWFTSARAECNGSDEQSWALEQGLLQNMGTSNSCLACSSTSTDRSIMLKSCDASSALQKWEFTKDGLLKNKGKNMCLDNWNYRMSDCNPTSSFKHFYWVATNTMLSTTGMDGKSYCLTKDGSAKRGSRYVPILSLCNGRGGQQYTIDSSSRFYESWQGTILTRHRGANFLYFYPGEGPHGNQAFTFTVDGYLKADNGQCLARKAGKPHGSSDELDLWDCKFEDRRQLVSRKTPQIIKNRSSGNCLSAFSNNIGVMRSCGSARAAKLQGGKLMDAGNLCFAYVSGKVRRRRCTDSSVTKTTWEYDPDAFWISYVSKDGSRLCLAGQAGSTKYLTVEKCKTEERFQWGDTTVFSDQARLSKFYFTAIPFKIHVMSQATDKCMYVSGSTVKFGSCSGSPWIFKKETGELSASGKCLTREYFPKMASCGTSKTGPWTYNPKSRQLLTQYQGSTRLLMWLGSGKLKLSYYPAEHYAPRVNDNTRFGANLLPVVFQQEMPPGPIMVQTSRKPFGHETLCVGADSTGEAFFVPCDDKTVTKFFLSPDGRFRHTGTKHQEEKILVVEGKGDGGARKMKIHRESDARKDDDIYQWKYDPDRLVLESVKHPGHCMNFSDGRYRINDNKFPQRMRRCKDVLARGDQIII